MIKNKITDCLCGSGNDYSKCCKPYILGAQFATTPEQLMRSRYVAFVTNSLEYILSTWVDLKRPATIQRDISTIWTGLEVTDLHRSESNEEVAFVSFIASFIRDNNFNKMKEKSMFIKQKSRWYYNDGDNTVSSTTISKKSQCPCGSTKKFKRCCGSTAVI